MDSIGWQYRYNNIKDFLFAMVNKEFLVFLFFLAVSTSFWFLSTLNETYETDIDVEMIVTEVPENVIITEELPKTVKITVKDKGFNLLNYLWFNEVKPLHFEFRLYSGKGGRGQVTVSDIQKMMQHRLSETASIISVKADHLDFFYNHGGKRKLPIAYDGRISTKANFYIARTSLSPDSIVVFAPEEVFDTLRVITTERVDFTDLAESTTKSLRLQNVRGAKLAKNDVKLNVIIDQLTEMTISVPVKTKNVPEGISLKTFPARVELRVAVGVKRSASLKPELFNVVADYNNLPGDPTEKIPLVIQTQPKGIVKATLKVDKVDYLIEKN